MSSNGSRSKKHSKDAKAERILQSLFFKNKSSIAPSSRKIKKKRRNTQEQSFQLHFRNAQNQRRTLQWIMPRSQSGRSKNSNSFGVNSSKRKKESQKNGKTNSRSKNESGHVNYGDLFESAYKVVKSESSASRSGKQLHAVVDEKTHETSQTRSNDSFSGIEYDPVDNYFYLVSHQTTQKKALFQNKGLFQPVQKPCLVINPRIVETLKKNYALESFLC